MENNFNATTYACKIGDTTFIIKNSFTGTKTFADAFEEIIVSAFRQKQSENQGNMAAMKAYRQ